MRIKFDKSFLTLENIDTIISMLKYVFRIVQQNGYIPSSLNMYFSFKDKEGNIIEYSDEIAPCYEVVPNQYTKAKTKFLSGEFRGENGETTGYIYESYSDDTGKWKYIKNKKENT